MEDLVRIARKTVEKYFKTFKLEIKSIDKYKEKKGAFVTIHTYPEHQLRGCIGYVEPVYPLYETVQRAVIDAAFHDYRFPPLKPEELNKVIFEVSVLSLPELITGNPKERIEKIENGKDGLILNYKSNSGLFLPQVWEQLPDKTEFLEALCHKAGVTPDVIYDKNAKLYKFNVQAFIESKPKGKIVKIY
ncbi:MAG: AmmeMemoRadiSam system protein A [Candidatus Aenigmatarchaeota archaeon]